MTAQKTRAIREALATKLNSSAACAAVGLRRTLAKVDEPLSALPELRILQPSAREVTGRPNAWQEKYTLTLPAELVMARPSGRNRADPDAEEIADAIGVEMRSGITLGLSGFVECELGGWSDGLQEYGDLDLPGLRLVFLVTDIETFSAPRTA